MPQEFVGKEFGQRWSLTIISQLRIVSQYSLTVAKMRLGF